MPATLFDAGRRDELKARVARLSADTPARWGRFTAPRMVGHLIEALRMAFGDLPCAPKGPALARLPGLKQFVMFHLPWPKGAPTAPELLAHVPASWDDDRAALAALVDRFASADRHGRWPPHPLFGQLTGEEWGRLAYRHADHHLQQFGV